MTALDRCLLTTTKLSSKSIRRLQNNMQNDLMSQQLIKSLSLSQVKIQKTEILFCVGGTINLSVYPKHINYMMHYNNLSYFVKEGWYYFSIKVIKPFTSKLIIYVYYLNHNVNLSYYTKIYLQTAKQTKQLVCELLYIQTDGSGKRGQSRLNMSVYISINVMNIYV